MKKILLPVAAVLVAVAAVTLWNREPAAPRRAVESAAGGEPSPLAEPAELVAAGAVPAEDRPAAEPVATAAARTPASPRAEPPAPTAGTLLVRARWDDDAPVRDEVVVARFDARSSDPDERTGRTDADGLARFDDVPPGPAEVELLRGERGQARVVAGETASLTLRLDAGLTVEGEVVDADGVGIPEAEVWLSERWQPARAHRVARADRAGRFRVRAVSGTHYVGARAPGRAPSYVQQVPGEPGETVAVRIVLADPAGGLAVRVVDAGGAPVEGARVLVGRETPEYVLQLESGLAAPGPPPLRGRTDASGRLALDTVPFGTLPVQARARGSGPWRGEVAVEPGRANRLEIVLQPEARVRGLVVDEEGEPVRGARVSTADPWAFLSSRTFSGLDGRFELGGLGGEVELVARDPLTGEARVALELAPGALETWDPVLDPTPRIHGVLLDEDGRPLVGWNVQVRRPDGSFPGTGPTDLRGRFSVPDLEDEPHSVQVREPGSEQGMPRLLLHDVRPGPEPLVLRLPPLASTTAVVVGRVVGPAGEPVAGVRLTISNQDERLWRSFDVDAETGAFRIECVWPGTCWFEARSDEHPVERIGEREVAAGELVDLGEVRLRSSGRLRVAVTGGTDEALGTLVPVLTDAEGGLWYPMLRQGPRQYRSGPLPEGDYLLTATGDFVVAGALEATVRAGEETARELVLRPAGLRPVVLVPPPDAPPASALWLTVLDGEGERAWHRGHVPAQDDGSLVARVSLPPGTYRFHGGTDTGLLAEGELSIAGYDGAEEALRVPLTGTPRSD